MKTGSRYEMHEKFSRSISEMAMHILIFEILTFMSSNITK